MNINEYYYKWYLPRYNLDQNGSKLICKFTYLYMKVKKKNLFVCLSLSYWDVLFKGMACTQASQVCFDKYQSKTTVKALKGSNSKTVCPR